MMLKTVSESGGWSRIAQRINHRRVMKPQSKETSLPKVTYLLLRSIWSILCSSAVHMPCLGLDDGQVKNNSSVCDDDNHHSYSFHEVDLDRAISCSLCVFHYAPRFFIVFPVNATPSLWFTWLDGCPPVCCVHVRPVTYYIIIIVTNVAFPNNVPPI